MVGVGPQQWESLVKWSATAFFVAGVFRLLNMALQNLGAFMGVTSPEWLRDLTYLIAFLAAYIGLLGLYPRVADRTPRLSSIGAGLAAVAGIALLIGVVGLIGAEEPPESLKLLPLFYLMGSLLSFLLFGVASWRTRTPSRTVAVLLFGTVAAFVFLIAGISSQIIVLIHLNALIFAVMMVGLGYILHSGNSAEAHSL